MSDCLIYGLFDPRTGFLRYVGKSSTGLSRPRAHAKPSLLKSKSKKNSWIKSLQSQGLTYQIEVLEECQSSSELNDAERFWIASIRVTGAELLNSTDGGDGQNRGYCPSAETRAKMSRSQKARPSNGLIGHKQTPEHIENRVSMFRGRPKPPRTIEHSRNNAAAHGGRTFTDGDHNLYFTIREAVEKTGLHYSTIHRALKGHTQTTKKTTFSYV